MPDGYIQERVYPMELGDPEELLKEIVGLELQGKVVSGRDNPSLVTNNVNIRYPKNDPTHHASISQHLHLHQVLD